MWVNNKMYGKGVLKWGDGREYTGDFENDKRHGDGKFKWKDGRIYIGQWRDGKQNGIGVFQNEEGGKERKGEWAQGKRIKWIKKVNQDDS